MRSILRQLKKYQTTKLEDPTEQKPEESTAIIKNSAVLSDVQQAAKELGVYAGTLNVSERTWTNILYPYTLLCAYHIVLVKKGYVPEDKCDKILAKFLKKNYNLSYLDKFKEASTPAIKRLVMFRVMLASYNIGERRRDNLDKSYRVKAAEYLHINKDMLVNDLRNKMDAEYAQAGIEELILARVGYLMIWYDMAKINRDEWESTSVFYLPHNP